MQYLQTYVEYSIQIRLAEKTTYVDVGPFVVEEGLSGGCHSGSMLPLLFKVGLTYVEIGVRGPTD